MESLNKQEIGFLKEQINDLKHEMTAGFAKLEAKLEILTEGYLKKDEFINHCVRSDNTYATKEEIKPIRQLVFGAAGLILVAVVTALIYQVVTTEYESIYWCGNL